VTTCDQCHDREAVVHLTHIADGQVTMLHLCERCAAEKGVESPASVQDNTLVKFVGATVGKGTIDPALMPAGGRTSCPSCGATLQDFRQSGRLGCAECYRTWEGALRDILRKLHGATLHMGERYTGRESAEAAEPTERAADLREQLRLAVETENFELAAEIRDRLRVLE
jgi:protein arginine kinase activator